MSLLLQEDLLVGCQKLQNVVALSTIEAKYMVASHGCKEAIWLQGLLDEFGRIQDKVKVFCDNQSIIHLARNPAYHSVGNMPTNFLMWSHAHACNYVNGHACNLFMNCLCNYVIYS
jgi:hypothetical protein